MIQRSSVRRALLASLVAHALVAAVAYLTWTPASRTTTAIVDIEVAPPVPLPEALPEEVARPPQSPLPAATEPGEAGKPGPGDEGDAPPIDAGVDAPIDAPIDAPVDARPRRRDAAVDAAVDAGIDAGIDAADDAGVDAADDAGALVAQPEGDAGEPDAGATVATSEGSGAGSGSGAGTGSGSGSAVEIAAGSGSGSGSGSAVEIAAGAATSAPTTNAGSAAGGTAVDTQALAAALAANPDAKLGATNEPAVPGAPTSAGTAANLLAYFPDGHLITALIRFDRLRGTEWATHAERLLRPMPDYRALFGARDTAILDKLDTLVISTPRPRDATATTLVARTTLARPALRELLGAAHPVTWQAAKGGLLGRRTQPLPGDGRIFLSPYRGWFLLAQPTDLGVLIQPSKGNLDTVEASGALPAWVAGIRAIEAETNPPRPVETASKPAAKPARPASKPAPTVDRGPALVVTIALSGKRMKLGARDFGLGISSVPTPERASLAMELVPQGWLLRGNLRCASDEDAAELVASVQKLQQRIADSRVIQLALGKPLARAVASLAFARSGPRISYAASVSIADARALLAFTAQQLDQYFGAAP